LIFCKKALEGIWKGYIFASELRQFDRLPKVKIRLKISQLTKFCREFVLAVSLKETMCYAEQF